MVWGFAAPGTVVNTTFDEIQHMMTTVGSDGIWRQQLPATEASTTPHSLAFLASTGQTAEMQNVLFGDVYLCGGQSNMQFSMPAIENASAEAVLADSYPLIRLFTVGWGTASKILLDDLQTIEQAWSVADHTSIGGTGTSVAGFGYFSAVCWIFGREVFDALGGSVPIGLISSNFAGTAIESWSTKEASQECNVTSIDSILYNAMINPYAVGPMALVGFTWYQGETNVDEHPVNKPNGKWWKPSGREAEGAPRYACTFPAMIKEWRRAFKNPDAYFGFVQLSTWCGNGGLIAEMRTNGQMSALSLPNVGYATNADHGAGCNIHPPPKQYCAKRLAISALALVYKQKVMWKSPSFKSQTASASPPSVTVSFNDVSSSGLRDDQYPFNYLGGAFNCSAAFDDSGAAFYNQCAWASLQLANGSWVNSSIAVKGNQMTLSLPEAYSQAGAPVASRYAWGAVPMMSVYDRETSLPLLAWSEKVTGDLEGPLV
jgi:sialate O-acetylesterase